MTRTVLAALSLAAVTAAPLAKAAAEDLKVGYVDLQRALNETEDGRKAKSNLKKVFDQKQKELDEQQESLKKDMDDLQKKRSLLSTDTLRQKESELQERIQKVQQTYMRHQQDLAEKEREATSKIFDRMQRIIVKIAGAENLTMVFDRNQAGLVFAKPHLDLTNEVIRRYNAGEGAEGGGGAASAAPAKPAAPAPKK